ncbi:cytochrome P450 [Actinoplanes hulinensis]|uniref:Cytochrome P450 n=1 Tax=Actinoplanes hulinensis TaxID=1144547 RepID=A0ABS7B1R3_9ACTN|nr:cytochrome P450 [Actinoplanes hulinensis]
MAAETREQVDPRPLPRLRGEDRGLPWVGNLFKYQRDPVALYQRHWDRYGPVAPSYMFGKTTAMLLGPDACGEALQNRDKAFANGPAWSRLVGPFFRRGLMLIDFDDHHGHRRIMQEAFTPQRLDGYTRRLHPAVERALVGWETGTEVPAYWRLKQLTLDIAADLFMGGVGGAGRDEMDRINRAFIACVQAAAGIVRADVPMTRWGRAYRGRRKLERFLRGYLPAKRATVSDDIFSVLCHIETEDGDRFSDDDVINHMIFLMMAAHDTSTITTTAILQYLGQHPGWQERCRAEALALGPAPDRAELDSLVSVDLVMREALRLRAPVPVLVRYTVKDTVVQGVRIPADTFCSLGIQFTHLMPEYWTDPTVFDPERFGPDRREDRSHRFAWMPFGGGVHKCIGMHFGGLEVKAILHRLLREYHWNVDPHYVAPLDHHALPFPKDGQPITLIRN